MFLLVFQEVLDISISFSNNNKSNIQINIR